MKALGTLVKLARRDLETLRRALADQIARQNVVEDRIVGHEQAIVAEQKAAQRDYEATRAYGGFAIAAIATRKALAAEQAIIADEIDRLRALISEAHVEVRKFERLIEMQAQRERMARQRAESAELDEFATLRAARVSPR